MLDIYLMKKTSSIPLDQVLKALGDPVRLSVVKQLLDEGEKTCGTFNHDLTKATFSHHLSILTEAGIISRREEGTRKYISLNESFKKEFLGLLKLIDR